MSRCDGPWVDERLDEILAKIGAATNEAELRAVDETEIAGHNMSLPCAVVLERALLERAKIICPHILEEENGN